MIRNHVCCCVLTLCLLLAVGCGKEPPANPDASAVAPNNKQVGETPFFPSNLTTPDGKPVALTDFHSNKDCFRCHEEIAEQWRGSMHAAAMTDPVFVALYKKSSEKTNGKTDKWCIGCHSSAAVLSGQTAPQQLHDPGVPISEGVSCVVCHSISGPNEIENGQSPSNASFVSHPAGPIIGPHGDLACLQVASKKTVQGGFRPTSESCASCHRLIHPWNGMVIDKTYSEWQESIYAKKGIQCQDCHMQSVEKMVETAKTLKRVANPGRLTPRGSIRSHVYAHNFLGGNSTVTGLLGNQRHSAMTEELLQNTASLEVLVPERASPNSLVKLRVRVTNETAGHDLRTSLVEIRQMWLDVRVTNAMGQEIFSSGHLDADGNIDPDAVVYHAIAVDAEGNRTVNPWEMVNIVYTHSIPAKSYALERFAFHVPPETSGALTIKVDLRYRSFSQKLANELLGDAAPKVKTTDMESAVVTIKVQ